MSNKLWEEMKKSGVISQQVQEALEQKFEEVRSEARKEIEEQVRSEFSARFEKDKGELVTALDKFVNESIRRELEEFQSDRKAVKEQKVRLEKAIKEARNSYKHKLAEHRKVIETFVVSRLSNELREFAGDRKAVANQRVKLSKAILEARKTYEQKLNEHLKAVNTFVANQLAEEIKEFQQDKKALQEQKLVTARKLREHREQLHEQYSNRMATVEKFVISQLRKEINEFKEDKRALVEQRVKLASEAKQKLAETQKTFVKKASKLVETSLRDHVKKEMTQFKDDIKLARQNYFGRKIFEAFASEFMSSHLSEGTQAKQLLNQLNEAKAKLDETTTQLAKQKKLNEVAVRKISLAEDRVNRQGVLNELLTPLKKDKRAIMGELLEHVKTENLRSAFKKYLPSVLNEGGSRSTPATKKPLVESRAKTGVSRPVLKERTGDKEAFFEAVGSTGSTQEDQELADLRRLALPKGIQTK